MGFWIGMFITVLVLPIIMVIIGLAFNKRAPKNINMWYGYRTSMSTKNIETWKFAHKYFAKWSLILGLIIFIPTIIVMLLVKDCDNDFISLIGTIVLFVELIPFVIGITLTEIKLRKEFDQDGFKK